MNAIMPRARRWRVVLDWLQWHSPAWLARRIPPWGIEWIETKIDAHCIICGAHYSAWTIGAGA